MRLESGRKFLYQWELDQRLEVPEGCTQVHFANGTTDKALYENAFEEDGKRLVKVPDTMLQVAAQLRCYAWDGASVIEHTAFDVVPREKPDLYVEPEEVRRFDKLEAELQARSQGRSANYDFHSGGWKRILNIIRSSSGQLNLCVVTPGAYRMTQILSLDITGFVKYAQDTSDSGAPVIVKRYENIFGEDDAMQKKPVRITKIRVGYPKAGTEFPEADGTIDYGANPINCYVDVFVEFDGTGLSGPYAAFNMNFAGFVENHNCEAVTEETDAPGTGYYGEELDYYEVAVKDIPFYLTSERMDGTGELLTTGQIGGGYGLVKKASGHIAVDPATEKHIDEAKTAYTVITPKNVGYAVKKYTADKLAKDSVAAATSTLGITLTGAGQFRINPATEAQIDKAAHTYMPITVTNVKYAVDKYTGPLKEQVDALLNQLGNDTMVVRTTEAGTAVLQENTVYMFIGGTSKKTLTYFDIKGGVATQWDKQLIAVWCGSCGDNKKYGASESEDTAWGFAVGADTGALAFSSLETKAVIVADKSYPLRHVEVSYLAGTYIIMQRKCAAPLPPIVKEQS